MSAHSPKLATYDEYVPVDEEWLGEVPADWEILRARYCFKEIDNRSKTGDQELLSLSKDHGLVPRSELTEEEHRADSLEGYKICQKGDVVMNKMQAWNGVFGLANQTGLVSPDYTVFRPREGIESRYYLHLFRTPLYVTQFKCRSRGIGTAYLRLNTQHFYDIPLYHPPSEVQRNIAQFIDVHTDHISDLLNTHHRLRNHLNQKRQVLITNAVIEGIDQTVSGKPSNVPWIDKIPDHWSETKLKYITRDIIDSEHKTAPSTPNGDYHIIRTSDVRDGDILVSQSQKATEETFLEWTQRGKPEPGDLIFTREAPAGEVGIVPEEPTVLLGQRTVLIKPDLSDILPGFLSFSLQSDLVDWYINLKSHGSTVDHLNMSDLRDMPIITPPLPEQREIVEYLNGYLGNHDKILTNMEDGDALLNEKQRSLITSVVTGKIDVSEWNSTGGKRGVYQ